MSDDDRIRVALADPDRAVTSPIGQAVAADPDLELVASAADARALLTAIGDRTVDAIVMDIAAAGLDPATLVRDVVERRPGVCLIMTGRAAPATTVARIMAAGATTFFPKPYTSDELFSTIRELRRAGPRPAGATGFGRARRGSLIAVYSPKGGVGTTTVATSLAVALAARGRSRVAIVDLDLQFGDVGVALDLKGHSSIADLLATETPVEEPYMSEIFVRHSSGVYALLAPPEPTDIGSIEVPEVSRLLDRLRAGFDYVVCDLWSALEELALATLRAADRVVLVTTPEVPALRHVRRVMNMTGNLITSDRTLIVANRVPAKVGVSVAEIERALGMPVAAQVPSDGVAVTTAINEGMSMLDPRGSAKVAKPFRALADALAKDLGRQREGALAPKAAVVPS